MDKNLTVQEALTKLLAEKKFLLNDGKTLMTELRKHVAPEHSMELAFFHDALVGANIGELLILADESGEDAHNQAKAKAIALLQKNNMPKEKAESVVEKLMTAMKSERTAEDYYNKGIVNIQEKEYDKALENFNRAIELDPKYIEAYDKRAMVYAITEHYNKAIQDYTEVIKLDSKNISAYRERGKCYDALSQYEAALKDCEKVLQLDPSDKSVEHMRLLLIEKLKPIAEVYYNDGITDLNKKNYSKAIKNFSRVIELNPTFADAYIKRGRCYYEVKQYKSASEDLEQAYKLAPNDEHIRSMHKILHEGLAASNGGKAALKTALKAAFKEESKPSLAAKDYYNDGITNLNERNYSKALENLSRAIKLDPKYIDAYGKRAMVYAQNEQYDKAILDYTKVIELDSENNSGYHERGMCYYILGQHKNALEDINKAVKLNPNDEKLRHMQLFLQKKLAETYYFDGITAMKAGKYDKALENFNRAIELNPEYTDAYGKRAMVYAQNEQYDKAILDYTEIIKLDSQNISAYRERGKCYDALSQHEAALKDYEKVLQLDPNDKSVERITGDDESDSDESDSGKSGSGESGDSKSGGSESDSGKSDSSKSVWQENGFKDKFFKFSGRLNRKQYIIRALSICLMSIIIIVVLTLIHDNFSTRKDVIKFSNIITVILFVAMGISHLSLLTRRWRDLGKPLWWILTCFIPPVFAYLILFKKGTGGKNKYGSDPLGVTANNSESSGEPSTKKTIVLIFIGVLVILFYPLISAREHNEKGRSYLNEQQYDKALEEFNQAISLYPSSSSMYFNRGATYLEKKNYDQAIADFDKAIELSPNYADAYNDRGLAYSYKGNREQAIKDCKKAVELDPKNELYKNNLNYLQNRSR